MTKSINLTLIALLFSVGKLPAVEKPDAIQKPKIDGREIQFARYPKVFIGEGNVKVDVAPYKAGEKEGAILVFHGIESDWDGKAINHSVEPGAYDGQQYVTTYQGKRFVTLVSRKDLSGKKQYLLFVPGIRDEISVIPSDGEAQATSPQAIYQEYADQQKH